jgi:hypothetical protein
MRANDGDSAYVPTTSVYSGIDELVSPQVGLNASARLNDVRGVGATNIQIQMACPGLPAGSLYTHDPLLFNSLVYALFADALTHDGPADLSRIDLDTVCNQIIAPALFCLICLVRKWKLIFTTSLTLVHMHTWDPAKSLLSRIMLAYHPDGWIIRLCCVVCVYI